MYLTEWEEFDFERDQSQQLWYEELVYGNWNDGPNGDGARVMVDDVPVPEGVQNNGSWYIHVFIVKAGSPLDMEEEEYRDQNVVYISRCKAWGGARVCCRGWEELGSAAEGGWGWALLQLWSWWVGLVS